MRLPEGWTGSRALLAAALVTGAVAVAWALVLLVDAAV